MKECLCSETAQPAHTRKAKLSVESGERVPVDAASTHIDLPGDLWSVLIVLKVLTVRNWDGDALFLDPNDRPALANAIEVRCYSNESDHRPQ